MDSSSIMLQLTGIVIAMALALLVYFRLAVHWGLLAVPEIRSSHTRPVIKAAGFIIPLGVFIFSLLLDILNIYVIAGLVVLSVISFIDDMKGLSVSLRLGVQCMAAGLLVYWLWTIDEAVWFLILALPWCIGHLNASNFMDGINGMLILNMAGLFAIYAASDIVRDEAFVYVLWLVVALLILLAFFNVRSKAVCFLGDVGSISLGWLSFVGIIYLIALSGQLSLIFSMSVFYVDTGMTLLYRLWSGKNIFQPHREHLYEILYNEAGISPIIISLSYLALQLLVNLYLFYVSPLWDYPWWLEGAVILAALIGIHQSVKRIYLRP